MAIWIDDVHWWKNRLPGSPISRDGEGTATNGVFSRGSCGEPRPKAWAQGARWPAGARGGSLVAVGQANRD
jgi:hypothetical protein